jgi:hypothetical protein
MYFISVPPSQPTIFDESGQEVRSVVGPYSLGDTVVLKCITAGGKAGLHACPLSMCVNANVCHVLAGDPPPQVTWWRDSHLADSSFESTSYGRAVQNTLTVASLGRDHLGAAYTCQASNNNISLPASARVNIDMKCKRAFDGMCLWQWPAAESMKREEKENALSRVKPRRWGFSPPRKKLD